MAGMSPPRYGVSVLVVEVSALDDDDDDVDDDRNDEVDCDDDN